MRSPSLSPSAALLQLASLYGIETAYTDIFHKRRMASTESLLAVLRALGAPLGGVADVPRALRERKRHLAQTSIEPVLAAWQGETAEVALRLPAGRARGYARCQLRSEDGAETVWELRLEKLRTEVAPEGERFVIQHVPLPHRTAAGYHRLELECQAGRFESLLICAPPIAYQQPGRAWGVFLPLYALQTRSSWGVGDLSDLNALQAKVGAWGGASVSTLPLCAAFLDEPAEISPYLPASRLFWNELYVDPRRAPEFEQCAAARRLTTSSRWQREVAAMRSQPLADPLRQMALKRPALEQLAQWLAQTKPARYEAFQRYVREHPRLRDYASFRAVRERRKAPWCHWPERLREGKLTAADSDACARLYHQYVQFLAEEQMQAVSERDGSRRAGLYLDLPLGVHPDSYDVWREPELFARDVSAGAPPDTLFLKGQNWGFPPRHPEGIRRTGYAHFIASLRHLFRYASGVRIDHVMALHRLFWIPRGMEAKDGVYVRYRPEEMYAILSLESRRFQTTVIGENLGTVPAAVNRTMERHGVQRLYVLQYEARPRAEKPLRKPPVNSTASLNTHDMTPFAGFVEAEDLSTLEALGVFNPREAARQKATRRAVSDALAQFFGVSSPNRPAAAASRLAQRCLEWLAVGPASMVLVNLEDLWGENAAQNVPGTSTGQQPNWRRKARYSLEELAALPQVRSALRKLNRLRGSG